MAKYLIRASYSVESAKGPTREGGSSRRTAVVRMNEALGGSLEAFYFAVGDTDAFVVADVPDASKIPGWLPPSRFLKAAPHRVAESGTGRLYPVPRMSLPAVASQYEQE